MIANLIKKSSKSSALEFIREVSRKRLVKSPKLAAFEIFLMGSDSFTQLDLVIEVLSSVKDEEESIVLCNQCVRIARKAKEHGNPQLHQFLEVLYMKFHDLEEIKDIRSMLTDVYLDNGDLERAQDICKNAFEKEKRMLGLKIATRDNANLRGYLKDNFEETDIISVIEVISVLQEVVFLSD